MNCDIPSAWGSPAELRPGSQAGVVLRPVTRGAAARVLRAGLDRDWQNPVTSHARQLAQAAALVAGLGVIVAEFFDIGQSRALAWARRLQAAALLAAGRS